MMTIAEFTDPKEGSISLGFDGEVMTMTVKDASITLRWDLMREFLARALDVVS
jgi:hypothetical protein